MRFSILTMSVLLSYASSVLACPGEMAIIKNGGFQCGLGPWTVDTGGRASYTLNTPGYNSVSAFSLTTNTLTADYFPPGVQQTVNLTPGRSYTLSFWHWFNNIDAGFIGVNLNGQPDATVDAADQSCCEIWHQKRVTFTPNTSPFFIRFEFLSSKNGDTFKIDDVKLV